MKPARNRLPVYFLALLAVSGPCLAQREDLHALFETFTDDWVRGNPNQAVSAGYFAGELQNRMEQQLTPQTLAWDLEQVALARRGLAELALIATDDFTADDALAAELMQWQLEMVVEAGQWLDYDFPVNQYNGANVGQVNALTVVHPFIEADDARNYVLRLAQLDDRLDEALARARALDEKGLRPPAFIVRATISQLQRFIAPAPEANPLSTTLAEKSLAIPELDAAERAALAARTVALVRDEVYPAWREALAFMQAQLPRTTEDAGAWRLPNGDDYYAHRLRRFTTTTLSAEEIHAIGLAEVARIEAEMGGLLDQLGIPEGTLIERAAELERRMAFPNTEAGRAALMARIDEILADARQRTAALFDMRPLTPVIARPYPEFRWANAPASYTSPPLDRSRPGIFQMPLRPERLTEFELRTLVYHETVPGHHYQIALTTENENLPRFMQIRALGGISAITEGWALYSERLAAESGWYEGDIAGRVGQLNSALFRARRLVVDTGLHAMGWTRQQAIDYGIEASEVERYVMNPGQACSYMIGQLKLVELRERMRAALGEDFSIREYHTLVLRSGIVPLEILERIVDREIARYQAGA